MTTFTTQPPIVKSAEHKRLIRTVTKRLRESLHVAVNEKDVENAYRQAISHYFPAKTASPFNVDGLLECDTVRSLLEFKFQLDLTNKMDQCGVLIQSLFYMKKFELAGKKMPTTVFVGDKNECFCMQSTVLAKYLSHSIDWTVAPSAASKSHPAMLKALVDDVDILPFVFDTKNAGFQFDAVIETIKALGDGVVIRVKITKDNIIEIFNYWRSHVLADKSLMGELIFEEDARVQTARQCDIFFSCLTDKETTYLHPRKKNCLVSRGENIAVNSNQHNSFFAHFSQKLSPSELEVVVANKDRIIDEVSRRRTGAFFTPSLWTAEAHKMIGEALGQNWREEYVVWDCASGTNNLTRDYNFRELYCSTLEQGDVNTVKDCGYNMGSPVFQYDFLNDDEVDVLGPKVPEGLRKAFEEGKKVLFLINPPYATANNKQKGTHKAGTAINKTNAAMKECGAASQQLYSQFMYRIMKLSRKNPNVSLGIFSKPAFMSAPSFAKFRTEWYGSFAFRSGMLFQASNFSDVSGAWGISFTVWQNGVQNVAANIPVEVKSLNDSFAICSTAVKHFYHATGREASKWVRSGLEQVKTEARPPLGSAMIVKASGYAELARGALGYMQSKGNSCYENNTGVSLHSSVYVNGHGTHILSGNLRPTLALFCARRSIVGNWMNDKDEYCIPEIAHPDYEQWNNDAIVYSLFNTASQQSALRGITYKGKKWDIRNQFFFMSNAEMRSLADAAGFQAMYEDSKRFPDDSYVYTLLQNTTLSDDAKAVLEEARQLVRDSMMLRESFHDENPRFHLASWDSGFAQMKNLWKQNFVGRHTDFIFHYKKLQKRLAKGVYTFGFLK